MKKKSWLKSGLWLTALSLGGCSLAPHYAPPTVQLPANYKDMGPWTPAAPADEQPRGDWWVVYKDSTLDHLEDNLSSANPDLAAALARYDQALQFAGEAEAAQYPQVGLDAIGTQNRQSADRPLRRPGQPDNYENDIAGGGVSYELDLWGKIRNQVAAGKANAQASQAESMSIRLSLEAKLADAYFSLRGLDAQIDLLDKTASAYHQALQITEDQHSGGIVSGLDVGRAQTQYASVTAQLTEATAQRALYEHEIAALIGVPAPSFSLSAAPVLPSVPVVPVSAPSVLLQRRPDIAAAERSMAAANAEIGVARAAFFPTLTLTATGGFQSSGGGINLFDGPNAMWAVGPALAVTLFDGGLRRAASKAAMDHFDVTSAEYRSVVLQAFREVQDNLVLSNDLADEEAQQQQAVQSAEHTEDLAMTLYENGAVTYLDVVTAQTAELDAQRSSLSITTRRLQASVDLVKAMGG